MRIGEIVGLMTAGAAAGAVNAIAGGGTLITFPTLLLFSTPPIVANATSTLALVLGTAGSVYGYRHHLKQVKPLLTRFLPVSLAGGVIGALLLTVTSEKTFSRLVPFLILFATLLFMSQGLFKRLLGSNSEPARTQHQPVFWGALLFQLCVAIYGGYFGAGIGILMLATLGFMGLHNIYEMNTVKTVLGSLINLVAAVWFIMAGLIQWNKMTVMTIGALGGYYLGSHYCQRIPQQRVRTMITVAGFIISVVTFCQEFLP